MADGFAFWRAALDGNFDLWDGSPQPGYYRRRIHSRAPWIIVAVFWDRGQLVCVEQGEEVDPLTHASDYMFNPITYEDYVMVHDGGRFPDEYTARGGESHGRSSIVTDLTEAEPLMPIRDANDGHQSRNDGSGT